MYDVMQIQTATKSATKRDLQTSYGVASIHRLLKIVGLFCRISALLQGSFAKQTYDFKAPTHRSHPISIMSQTQTVSFLYMYECRHRDRVQHRLQHRVQHRVQHRETPRQSRGIIDIDCLFSLHLWMQTQILSATQTATQSATQTATQRDSQAEVKKERHTDRQRKGIVDIDCLFLEIDIECNTECNTERLLDRHEESKGWLQLEGSIKLQVSFAKEPYITDYILHKRLLDRHEESKTHRQTKSQTHKSTIGQDTQIWGGYGQQDR